MNFILKENMYKTMLKQNQIININNLFNVKFHIGENKEKWNPLIKNYVFGFRHGVYFFNLNKTLLLLKKLIYLFKKITQYHQVFLFIGTNHTVSCIVSLVAKTLKQPSITKKWVGGTLTNWLKIKPYIDFLYKTNVNAIRKKFVLRTEKKIYQKINRYTKMKQLFKGMENVKSFPNLIILLDTENKSYSLLESKKFNLPLVHLVSTLNEISNLSYPVIGNNKYFNSIFFFINIILNSIKTGEQLKRINLINYSFNVFSMRNEKSLKLKPLNRALLSLFKYNNFSRKYKNYSFKFLNKYESVFGKIISAEILAYNILQEKLRLLELEKKQKKQEEFFKQKEHKDKKKALLFEKQEQKNK
jgi:small subunit ribosomal protein S2